MKRLPRSCGERGKKWWTSPKEFRRILTWRSTELIPMFAAPMCQSKPSRISPRSSESMFGSWKFRVLRERDLFHFFKSPFQLLDNWPSPPQLVIPFLNFEGFLSFPLILQREMTVFPGKEIFFCFHFFMPLFYVQIFVYLVSCLHDHLSWCLLFYLIINEIVFNCVNCWIVCFCNVLFVLSIKK